MALCREGRLVAVGAPHPPQVSPWPALRQPPTGPSRPLCGLARGSLQQGACAEEEGNGAAHIWAVRFAIGRQKTPFLVE